MVCEHAMFTNHTNSATGNSKSITKFKSFSFLRYKAKNLWECLYWHSLEFWPNHLVTLSWFDWQGHITRYCKEPILSYMYSVDSTEGGCFKHAHFCRLTIVPHLSGRQNKYIINTSVIVIAVSYWCTHMDMYIKSSSIINHEKF